MNSMFCCFPRKVYYLMFWQLIPKFTFYIDILDNLSMALYNNITKNYHFSEG